MNRFLLFTFTFLLFSQVSGQDIFSRNFMYSAFSQKKFTSQLNRNKFEQVGGRLAGDTVVNVYQYKPGKRSADTLAQRLIETYTVRDNFSFAFFTSAADEFSAHCSVLKKEGFFIGNENNPKGLLFQKGAVTVLVEKVYTPAGDTLYGFYCHEAQLPPIQEIQLADDLLALESHEQLVSVFGAANVIKDVYYFSDKEVSPSSVLFPKTRHQAVFIWKDELNYRDPYYIMLGGNIKTGSSADFNGLIEENEWVSSEGIYSGMSLADLVRLNGNDISFYGKNSDYPFMVLHESSGALNFSGKTIVLGCLDTGGTPLLEKEVISAREILSENPGIYVFMILLEPARADSKNARLVTMQGKH